MGKSIYKLLLLALVLGAGLFTTSNAQAQAPTYLWSVSCHAHLVVNHQIVEPRFEGSVGVRAPYRPGDTLTDDQVWDLKGLASAECQTKVKDFYRRRCASIDRTGTINWGVGVSLVGWMGEYYWIYYPNVFVNTQIFVSEVCGLRTPPDDRPCRRPCP